METTYKMKVIRKPKPDPRLMTQTELFAYVHELETENARLEELYQKSVGVIAADTLPTLAEMRKVSEMSASVIDCHKCLYFDKERHICRFDFCASHWDFGGAK